MVGAGTDVPEEGSNQNSEEEDAEQADTVERNRGI